MSEKPNLSIRKKNRLSSWDYRSHGAYFITICTQNQVQSLCSIVGDGLPVPKPAWNIAEHYIRQIPLKYPNIQVQKYVIMPNHIHLLLFVNELNGAGTQKSSVSDVIAWYKYQVTKTVNQDSGTISKRFFQRSFHDHVIRNERDYQRIWEYIENNPGRWNEDCFFAEQI